MKGVTLQRALSVTVALLLLAEWLYLGCVTPLVKEIQAGFGADARSFDWPYPYVMSFHWLWCIPVGVLLATGTVVKDRWCSRSVAGLINLLFLAGVGLAILWIWGTVPHRMIQTAQKEFVPSRFLAPQVHQRDSHDDA